jgi:hypothetical protein
MRKYLSRDILVAHVTEHIFNLKSHTYEIANLCEYITDNASVQIHYCVNTLNTTSITIKYPDTRLTKGDIIYRQHIK